MNDTEPQTGTTAGLAPSPATRADLEAWCEGMRLPAPPDHEALSREIVRIGEHLFASWRPEASSYDFAVLMEEAWIRTRDGDWLFGIDGHGMQSWALHWVQRIGPLLLGFQLPFGGAFSSHKSDREAIAGAVSLVESIYDALDRAAAAGRLPDDRTLVALDSRFQQGCYAWIKHDTPWREADWQEEPMAAYVGLMELEALGDPAGRAEASDDG